MIAFDIEGIVVKSAVSVGVALYPLDGGMETDLVQATGTAAYVAKRAARDRSACEA
jgi:GGDEF domain-containing protein